MIKTLVGAFLILGLVACSGAATGGKREDCCKKSDELKAQMPKCCASMLDASAPASDCCKAAKADPTKMDDCCKKSIELIAQMADCCKKRESCCGSGNK